MRKKAHLLDKILTFIIAILFLIFCSDVFHKMTQGKLSAICILIMIPAVKLRAGATIVGVISDAWKKSLEKKEKNLWVDIKDYARINILHLIANKQEMSMSTIYQLMRIYKHDLEVYKELLRVLIEAFDLDDRNKDVISYIFLEYSSNSVVANMFEERPALRLQCENISKKNMESILNFETDISEVNEKIIIGMLNGCLPNSILKKNEVIHLLRGMLSWMLRKLKKQTDTVDENEKNIMILVIVIIPLIRNKLSNAGIYDKCISERLNEIENSTWTTNIVFEACEKIIDALNIDDGDISYIDSNIEYVCILYTYHYKLLIIQREKLYQIIRKKKRDLKYYLNSDYKMLSVLLYASSMQESNSGDDIMYELAAIACMCAGQFIPS